MIKKRLLNFNINFFKKIEKKKVSWILLTQMTSTNSQVFKTKTQTQNSNMSGTEDGNALKDVHNKDNATHSIAIAIMLKNKMAIVALIVNTTVITGNVGHTDYTIATPEVSDKVEMEDHTVNTTAMVIVHTDHAINSVVLTKTRSYGTK